MRVNSTNNSGANVSSNGKMSVALLRDKLNADNRISVTSVNLNRFTDTFCITANATKECLTLHVDLVDRTVTFWNDCNEKFVQPLANRGIEKIIGKLKEEFEQTYYFKTVNCSQVVATYPVKFHGAVDLDTLKGKAAEIQKHAAEAFDYIEVHNFIGSKRYKVIFYENKIIIEK